MPPNNLTHLIHQFVLVILLVNVNKKLFCSEGKHVTSHGGGGGPGGGGQRNVTRWEGGLKSVRKVSRIIGMAL
jgi:hypothetical protein